MEAKNISGMLVTYLSSGFLIHSSWRLGEKMNQAFKISQATHQTCRWLNLPQKSQQLIDGSSLIYQMYISRSSSGGYGNEKCATLSAQLVDLKVEPAWVTSIDLLVQVCFPLGASEAADKSRIILSSIRLHFPTQEHWNDKPDQVTIARNKDVFRKQQMKTNYKQINQISAFVIVACWRQHCGLRIRRQAVDGATSWQFDPPVVTWGISDQMLVIPCSLFMWNKSGQTSVPTVQMKQQLKCMNINTVTIHSSRWQKPYVKVCWGGCVLRPSRLRTVVLCFTL